MPRTYRDAILETVKLSLAAIQQNFPVDDPYEWAFSEVVRGPIVQARTKRLQAGVVPGDEVKTDGTSFRTCLLQVLVDFRFTVNVGDDSPSEEAEKILGIIERRVLADRTLNGLAIETKVLGNSVDLDSSVDKNIDGSIFFEVQYRHDLDDPRYYLGDPPDDPTPTAV